MYDPGPDKLSNNCISLHRNENLFVDPLFLTNLISQAIKDISFFSYPESTSYELRKAIGEYHNCIPEKIYVGNGADGVLADIFCFLRDKYEEIGLQSLTYQVYPYLCSRYKYQQKSLNETEQLWVIDSPNSITGETFNFLSIKKLPKFLIWDNVYGEFDPNNEDTIPQGTEIIRINSFSKFFALASLRIGYCIGNTEFISKLLERKDIFNVNALAQKTAILALNNKDYFSSLVSKMLMAKQILIERLTDIGFSVTRGKANFIWVTHPHIKMKLLQEELAKASILVRRFQGAQMENYLRITIPPQNIMDKLLFNINNIIKKLS